MAPKSDAASSKSAKAAERLSQVASHVANGRKEAPSSHETSTKNRKPRASRPSGPPADYSDILSNLEKLRIIASTPDTKSRGYVRQKRDGKLWVRERLEQLLDKDSWKEIGSASGKVQWKQTGPRDEEPESFTPSNNLQGFGMLKGRKIVLTADDYSIRAGHADGATAEKTVYAEKMALALQLPMIKLTDGSSGGGSVTSIKASGWSYIPGMPGFMEAIKGLNMGIPNLAAVLGPGVSSGTARF